jgi:adenylate cyclase, class 2
MAAGPVETEIKLRIQSAGIARDLLIRNGFAERRPRVFESNIIYDSDDEKLRGSGRLLRLRSAGACNVLTFKGKAGEGKHKSRTELEIEISDAVTGDLILRQLGFSPRFRYEKFRTEFAKNDLPGYVTVDETPLGCFLELEGPPEWIDETAALLGFLESDYVTASYGRLWADHRTESSTAQFHMIFDESGGNLNPS